MFAFIFGLILLLAGFLIAIIKSDDYKRFVTVIVGCCIFVCGICSIVYSTLYYIDSNEIGIVVKKFGSDIPSGKIIAMDGQAGVQAETLTPGWNFGLWPWQYEVVKDKLIVIERGYVGVVCTTDGKTPPVEQVFAPQWDNVNDFLNASKFLKSDEGYKGNQLTVLLPGIYRFNTRLYSVKTVPVTNIRAGEVAVIKCNSGETQEDATKINGITLVDTGFRGIWNQSFGPGNYNFNTLAYEPIMVNTSKRVFEYVKSAYEQKQNDASVSDPVQIRTKDGFTASVDLRVLVSVTPEDASKIVAMLGNPDAMVQDGEDKGKITNLEARLVLPVIKSILRNEAEKINLLDLLDSRSKIERAVSDNFIKIAKENFLHSDGILINNINPESEQAKALIETRTNIELAKNQQAQYAAQVQSQNSRAEMVRAQAAAEQQKNVTEAEYAIVVQEKQAQAAKERAIGLANARIEEGRGEAQYILQTAQAKKDAYLLMAQGIGANGVISLEIFQQIAKGKIKITPDIMLSGAGGDSSSLNGILAKQLLQGK